MNLKERNGQRFIFKKLSLFYLKEKYFYGVRFILNHGVRHEVKTMKTTKAKKIFWKVFVYTD